MKFEVEIYNKVKYERGSEVAHTVTYSEVKGFKVVTEDQLNAGGFDDEMRDPYGEYLVLEMDNGDTATFRNSYVDLFKAH